MDRQYPYCITLRMYSGKHDTHYVKASNYRDAFSKAQHYAIPIAMSGYDGVQFIDVNKLTRQYCTEHNIIIEEA